MKVITFSRNFPAYHPRKGEPTYFMEKIWKQLKSGNRSDGEYSIWTKVPRLMKDGHWQLPHLWRDQMMQKEFTPKYHTIRAGNRWNVGDFFSPRIWSGKPYWSKQIQFAPPVEVKKVWTFERSNTGKFFALNENQLPDSLVRSIAKNDGLNVEDFKAWFNKQFFGQIICWNDLIEY